MKRYKNCQKLLLNSTVGHFLETTNLHLLLFFDQLYETVSLFWLNAITKISITQHITLLLLNNQ